MNVAHSSVSRGRLGKINLTSRTHLTVTRGGTPPEEGAPLIGLVLCNSLWRPRNSVKWAEAAVKMKWHFPTLLAAAAITPFDRSLEEWLRNQFQHPSPCVFRGKGTWYLGKLYLPGENKASRIVGRCRRCRQNLYGEKVFDHLMSLVLDGTILYLQQTNFQTKSYELWNLIPNEPQTITNGGYIPFIISCTVMLQHNCSSNFKASTVTGSLE